MTPLWSSPWLDGDPDVDVAEGLGALDVEVLQAGHIERGATDERVDPPVEVTAAEQLALQGVEPLLPAGHAGVGRSTVLDEVERAAGAQDPSHFDQGALDVGDGAQGPGGEHVVDAGVLQGQLLAVEADVLDGHAAGGYSLGGELSADRRGVHGADPFDGGRVVGDVAAGAEPDFEDLAVEAGGRLLA